MNGYNFIFPTIFHAANIISHLTKKRKRMMLLVIDMGNTNLTLGIYDGENLKSHYRLSSDHERMPDEYGLQLQGILNNAGISAEQIDGICLASVVPPLTQRITEACEGYLKISPFIIDQSAKSGVINRYDDPSAVGADRICDATAAVTHYGAPVCIADFGTGTTFNAVNAKREYLGGAIAPGIGIATQALISHAAKLQTIDLQLPPSPIGTNTQHAMQSGMIYGYVSMFEGMEARFRKILGAEMKVVITGGLGGLISQNTQVEHVYAPWLTLEGLRLIWNLNTAH
jgi:type III pantothenate kinase